MGELVVNNVVKMEWQKKGWLQTSSRKGKGVFIFCTQEYESENPKWGTVSVFFTDETAFVIASDEGTDDECLWDAPDFIAAVKQEMGGNFPYEFEEYVPIITSGDWECDIAKLEKYGILYAKDDIEARRKDIAPYGYEEEFVLGGN